MERACGMVKDKLCLLQRTLKLGRCLCESHITEVPSLSYGNNFLLRETVCRRSSVLQFSSIRSPSRFLNTTFSQRCFYGNNAKWWSTPNQQTSDSDEFREDGQTGEGPDRILGSIVLAEFKSKLDTGEHSEWTHRDWEYLESQLITERENLAKIWEAFSMRLLWHHGLIDAGRSLLDYIRSQGRSPNISTLTAFIALCGAHGGKLLQDIVFRTYEELLEKTDVFDGQSCKYLIEGLSGTNRWKEALDLVEMSKISQEPTSPFYSPVAAAAFREGDFSTGFELLKTMGDIGLMPQAKALLSLVEACTLNGDLASMVVFFEHFRRYSWFPTVDVAKMIEQFFLSLSNTQGEDWHTSWATVNRYRTNNNTYMEPVMFLGVCSGCGQRMAWLELSPSDFKELQETFLQTALVGGNVFLKTSPSELQRFTDFIRSTSPYDVILDSLNIAFRLSNKASVKLKVDTLLQVVEHFVKRKKRVLVLGRNHMKSWPDREMNRIRRLAQCFFTDNMSEDDAFLLYATLYSGSRAMFVSADEMRDHRHLLGPRLGEVFKQWQRSRQIFFLGTNRYTGNLRILCFCGLLLSSVPLIQYFKPVQNDMSVPKSHDTLIQKDSCGWHVPYDTGQQRLSFQHPNTWLCLRQGRPKK